MNEDFARLGDLVRETPGQRAASASRRLAEVWQEALGEEVATNSRPRSLRRGRLLASTSSAVWAQTLQLLSTDVVARLNAALGEALVEEVTFRPAGWDPGGGLDGPRALGGEAPAGRPDVLGGGADRPPPRTLSPAEESAVRQVEDSSCDEELGRAIAAAMRASLERSGGASERG